MKTKLIIGALLSTALLNAQTTEQKETKKTATVRIKKIENINGVEKITDTTYTTTDPALMKLEETRFDQKGDTKTHQVIVIDDEKDPKRSDEERTKEVNIMMKDLEGKSESDIQKEVEKMMNDDLKKNPQAKNEKRTYSKMVVIKVDMTDPNEAEMKKIARENGETDRQLKVDELKFFPNPSNGKQVNLSFELAEKGDATVSVLNMEGKAVYTEKLNNFTGAYNKTIDISDNAKGIYFVRVEQGKHAQVKKIVLE